ncbi:MAG: ferritin-like domain-containing protein [Acidimicrobiia bacterium]|nr:ferritin-like domain-containing protein [Acidimicrobiia bacterium]
MRTNEELVGRASIDDVDGILGVEPVPTGSAHVPGGCDTIFTWDYEQRRDQLTRLYEKAKGAQWNGTIDLDWSTDVDQEAVAVGMNSFSPEIAYYRKAAAEDRDCPLYGWTDEHFIRLAIEQQNFVLSQIFHGEQGALLCTAKIVETVPFIEAKYYASTQVMDEARHVEVFAKYLRDKLGGEYPVNPHLYHLLADILADERWDITYLGMQVIVEGLALTVFGLLEKLVPEPLLQKLVRLVMSDEARHVAFGVISLKEVYDGMSTAELRERQEFAFEAGLRIRDRSFAQEMWGRLDVDPRHMLEWLVAGGSRDRMQYQNPLFMKVVPNLKKLGLLDADGGWLREKYTEMGVIQFEDLVDTSIDYEDYDAVSA